MVANKMDNTKAVHPFADSAITQYIAKLIEVVTAEKTQREISAECGYKQPNMISMIKRGEVRVPLEKIPLFAKSLHVDEIHLFRLWLSDVWPDSRTELRTIGNSLMSKNERALLDYIRQITKDQDLPLTQDLKKRLKTLYAEYKP